jgi:Fe-S cluster assembly protein SufD
MNTPLPSGAAGFLARYVAERSTLPGDAAARDAAAEIFRARGFPTMRDEAWKFTNLRLLADMAFTQSSNVAPCALLARLPALDVPRLVFVDGVFHSAASVLPHAMNITLFADAPSFGALAQPAREPMVALNTMLARDGVGIDVPAGMDGGVILLASIGTAGGASFHPRHRITLAPGARLTILDVAIGDGAYLHNPVTEITVAEDAVLTHIRVQDEAPTAFHLATIYTDIAARGTYDSFSLALGARLARA